MTREEKTNKKIERSQQRSKKNGDRNRTRKRGSGGRDCPYAVEINNSYGTCHCNGESYNDCLGDI